MSLKGCRRCDLVDEKGRCVSEDCFYRSLAEVVVRKRPKCDVCREVEAVYDGKTVDGPEAWGGAGVS